MKFTMDGPNARLELNHQETDDLLKALAGGVPAITGLLTALGVPAFALGVIAAALALHATWEGAAIKAADKGQGVFLTSPMVPFGPVGGLVIPTTRYEFDNADWSANGDDVIGSTEGDVIETHIDNGGDPKTVVFRLNNQAPSGWDKALMLRDGLGSQFWIQAKGFSQAENGLWADQVRNGQPVNFWKPKFLGQWADIFAVYGLERLQPGSVVTFTWKKD